MVYVVKNRRGKREVAGSFQYFILFLFIALNIMLILPAFSPVYNETHTSCWREHKTIYAIGIYEQDEPNLPQVAARKSKAPADLSSC